MTEYKFEIQGATEVTVEADSAEAARMILLENPDMYENAFMDDCYISEGDEVTQ
jgi:hypothetical protein